MGLWLWTLNWAGFLKRNKLNEYATWKQLEFDLEKCAILDGCVYGSKVLRQLERFLRKGFFITPFYFPFLSYSLLELPLLQFTKGKDGRNIICYPWVGIVNSKAQLFFKFHCSFKIKKLLHTDFRFIIIIHLLMFPSMRVLHKVTSSHWQKKKVSSQATKKPWSNSDC